MGKKHSLLKTVLAATAALYATNTAIDYHAKEKNLCSTAKGVFMILNMVVSITPDRVRALLSSCSTI